MDARRRIIVKAALYMYNMYRCNIPGSLQVISKKWTGSLLFAMIMYLL